MRRIYFLILIFIVLTMIGCSDTQKSTEILDIHDLEVPDGFSFETTMMMNIRAFGPVTRTLSISNQDNELVFKGLLDREEGFDRSFPVSTSTTRLVFTYNGQTQERNVSPSTECFCLTFSGNRAVLDDTDTDGDGVPDEEDDWPEDPELAYRVVYPPQPADSTRCCFRNWSTIAYEDLWPQEGDYDFNDVIINYAISEGLNNCNHVREIEFDLYYSVDGAGYNDGFYIKLPFDEEGVASIDFPDSVSSREGFDFYYDTENGGDGNLVLRFFEEGHSFMPDEPQFHNTEEENGFTDPVEFDMTLYLYDSEEYEDRPIYDMPPYNPFLVIDQDMTREVHLANYPCTGNVNTVYFGQQDDTTDPLQDRYYVTAGNLPWAIMLSTTFDHPLERVSIIDAYPEFADWVTSGGMTNANWYDNPVEENVYDFVDQFNDFIWGWDW